MRVSMDEVTAHLEAYGLLYGGPDGEPDDEPRCEDCGLSVEGIRCTCGRGMSAEPRKSSSVVG